LMFHSKHHLTLPYHPQANGMVERVNKELKKHVACICNEMQRKPTWSRTVPALVQRVINSSYHRSIGTTPMRMLFGSHVTENRGLLVPWEKVSGGGTDETRTVHAAIDELDSQLREIIGLSQRFQQEVVAKRLAHSPPVGEVKLDVGNYVLVSYPNRPPNKLTPQWQGPFVIVHIDDERDYYYCQDVKTLEVQPFHLERLKRFYHELSEEQLKELRDWDQNEYYVERILEYTGEPKRRRTLRFRVRFAGQGELEDEWLPWREVKELEALDAFIAEHPELECLNK
jgi:hypothetical protein